MSKYYIDNRIFFGRNGFRKSAENKDLNELIKEVASELPSISLSDASDVPTLFSNGILASTVQAELERLVGLINNIPTALTPKGVWDADTNTPDLTLPANQNEGDYYRVSVAGTTDLNGINTWNVADHLFFNDSGNWSKIDNSSSQTDLGANYTATNVTITSSDGNDVTIAAATNTNAGLLTAAYKQLIDALQTWVTAYSVPAANEILVTPAGNITELEVQSALQELDGITVKNNDMSFIASTGTIIQLNNNRGGRIYGQVTPVSDAAFTLGTKINNGFAIIRHQHSSAPTITGATDLGVADNYVPNETNIILLWVADAANNLVYSQWQGSH